MASYGEIGCGCPFVAAHFQVDGMTFSPVLAACPWDLALWFLRERLQRYEDCANVITMNAAIHACESASRWKLNDGAIIVW